MADIKMKLLIIQPWFSAIGHPAQSLINMASAIGRDDRVEYLVARNKGSEFFQNAFERLKIWGEAESYAVVTQVGASNTVKALVALWRLRKKGRQYQRVFFFDESLFALALLWPLFSLGLHIDRVGVLHLFGPRGGTRGWLDRFVIGMFLKRAEVRLYLRTEEMAMAWREHYRVVAPERISCLPSLEIPDDEPRRYPANHSGELAFGIVGQVRVGKGIEWLVPVFQNTPSLGKLTVAGEFASPESRKQLSVLNGFEGFINCFMTEDDMLERAAAQDYLLMLYDLWDKRMESAVLYLAARINRPVVVYGDNWSGRMVREFRCGVEVPAGREAIIEILQHLPKPGSEAYADLLRGMEAFRRAHSVKSLRGKVIEELLG